MYYNINRIIYSGAIILLLSAWIVVGCESRKEESSEKTIAANDERIKAIKEKIKKSNTPNLDKIREERIDDLEKRNAALRTRLMEYKEDQVHANWEKFKSDVQKQLDDMEKDLKDLDKD